MATATPDSLSEESEREARLEDREAVLDLDRNVHFGLDYLLDHYDVVLTNPAFSNHVYEKQGEVVGFVSAKLLDGGQTLVKSGRVGLADRGGRMYGRFIKGVLDRWRGYPALRHVAMTINNDNKNRMGHRLLREYTTVMEKDITTIDVDLKRIRYLTSSLHHPEPFHMMTYDDVKCMMSHHPNQLRHLFPEERILSLHSWWTTRKNFSTQNDKSSPTRPRR